METEDNSGRILFLNPSVLQRLVLGPLLLQKCINNLDMNVGDTISKFAESMKPSGFCG